MKKLTLTLIALVFALSFANKAKAQCDSVASFCTKHIISTFISDGQQYRALLLNSEETAEFHTTFFGETIYRIAACSGSSDGNLVFSIYDQDRNLLFSNRSQKNAPYWDFKVKNTLECIIEAQIDVTRNQGSGCAVILIGFKQK